MLSFSPGCVAAEIIWWYEKDSVIADKGKNIFSETIVHEGWSILRLRFALFFGNFFKKCSRCDNRKFFVVSDCCAFFFLRLYSPEEEIWLLEAEAEARRIKYGFKETLRREKTFLHL